MTREELKALNLPLDLNDEETALMVESAALWIEDKTTFRFANVETVPANVKLFIIKYCDVMSQSGGIASESIAGMSQSFNGGSTAALLAQIAGELLSEYGYSSCRFVSAKRKWS